MIEAIEPATHLLGLIGIHETAESLTARLIGDSKNRISSALMASPATLMSSLDTWPTDRVDTTTEDILRGVLNGER
jgi:ABC-type histidine transport system ATPase subunit